MVDIPQFSLVRIHVATMVLKYIYIHLRYTFVIKPNKRNQSKLKVVVIPLGNLVCSIGPSEVRATSGAT